MACHEKQVIKSQRAPAPIGPYSIATGGGPFIFTAGQIGIDPATGELVEGVTQPIKIELTVGTTVRTEVDAVEKLHRQKPATFHTH